VSAYAIAAAHGFTGTEAEWVAEQRQYVAAAEAAKTEAETAKAAAEAGAALAEAFAAAGFVQETVTGAAVSFADGADGVPVIGLSVEIEPVQTGSGDPSPDNVRPFATWSGLTIRRGDGEGEPTAIPVSWASEAGSIFGGTLDVTTGVLTVRIWGHVFDGTEEWSLQSGSGSGADFFRYKLPGGRRTTSSRPRGCSHFANATVTSPNTTIGFYAYSADNNAVFQIRPGVTGIATAADFQAWIANQYTAGTPLQCWAECTPASEYQLTPQEIRTLLGANAVSTDVGTLTLTYRADTKKYIDAQIAVVQAMVLENIGN